MHQLPRRTFIQSVTIGAAALATGACGKREGPDTGRGDEGEGILVSLFLAGGNDGLRTVVPLDEELAAARGEVGIDPAATTGLGEGFGLNPKLPTVAKLWKAGEAAVVHGVGYPSPQLSHFTSMQVWWGGDPRARDATGWVGRWLDRQKGHDPMRALSIGLSLSPSLAGKETAGAVVGPATLATTADADVTAAWQALGKDASRGKGASSYVGQAVADIGAVTKKLAGARDRLGDAGVALGAGSGASQAGGPKRATGLATQLEAVAALIGADLGTRVFTVQLGGFDTHSDEVATHDRLLGELDDGIEAFWAALSKSKVRDRVTLLVWSEFGRRVAQNGSGTDHGTAGPLLLFGPALRQGHHGEPPSLSKLDDDGNLVMTTDFRRVYAAVLEEVLGTRAGDVLAGRTSPLSLFR